MLKVQNPNLNFQQQVMFFNAGFSAQQALHEEDHKKEHHMNYDPSNFKSTQERLNKVKQNFSNRIFTFFEKVANRLSVQPQDLTVFV